MLMRFLPNKFRKLIESNQSIYRDHVETTSLNMENICSFSKLKYDKCAIVYMEALSSSVFFQK